MVKVKGDLKINEELKVNGKVNFGQGDSIVNISNMTSVQHCRVNKSSGVILINFINNIPYSQAYGNSFSFVVYNDYVTEESIVISSLLKLNVNNINYTIPYTINTENIADGNFVVRISVIENNFTLSNSMKIGFICS